MSCPPCERVDVVRDVAAVDRGVDRTTEHRDRERGRDREAEHPETAHDPPACRDALDQADRDRNEHRQRGEREDQVHPHRDPLDRLGDVALQAPPHEGLGHLVEPEEQRQRGEQDLLGSRTCRSASTPITMTIPPTSASASGEKHTRSVRPAERELRRVGHRTCVAQPGELEQADQRRRRVDLVRQRTVARRRRVRVMEVVPRLAEREDRERREVGAVILLRRRLLARTCGRSS